MKRAKRGLFVAALWLVTGLQPLWAQENDYFRYDHGVAKGNAPLPSDFDKGAKLIWKTPLASGHSTPCVVEGHVFVTTFDKELKELAVVALSRKNGEQLWKRVVPAESIEAVHASGSPATSSPASNGRQVFAFFGSYGLVCYDFAGNLQWEKRMGPFQDEFGAASSPILVDDKVILNEDHDIDNFLIAVDQATGKEVWKTPRPEFTRSYSTPIVLERDGKKQIVVAGSLQIAAYDSTNGEKIWWYDGISRIVDSTPIVDGGLIFMATWTPGGDPGERISMEPFSEALTKFDGNKDRGISRDELPKDSPVLDRFFRIDLNQNQLLEESEWVRHAKVFERAQNVAVAIEPGSRGALAPQYVRWTYSRGLPTVPSSVVYDGVLTMVKDSGIVTLLDRNTGEMVKQFRSEGRGNYYSSIVAGDGKVYLASETGVITVLKSGHEGKILSSHDFGERLTATPVLNAGQVFVRTESSLNCYEAN